MMTPTFIEDDFESNAKFDGGSRLVLGTSGIGGLWGNVDETESIDAILYALGAGVEVIDTSPSYSNAQEYVGKALQRWDGKPPFISTKIGRLQADEPDEVYLDYSREGLQNSLNESLELLGVDQVDLLFLHEPQLVPIEKMDEILDVLRRFRAEGLVGRLGIGGNPDNDFWPYVTKENFDVVSSFLKMDACTLEGFAHDIPKFDEEDLPVYAASSLHMGLLGSRFESLKAHPPENEWITQLHIDNAVKVSEIAGKHGLSLTNLALRYLFSLKEADRVVLGPKTIDEVKASLRIWNEGPLEKEVFDEVTNMLMKSINGHDIEYQEGIK